MDQQLEGYANNVSTVTAAVLGPTLVGVYLHGSAVLGGFDARQSDVDILVVCEKQMTSQQQTSIADQLSNEHLVCPAKGLEFSVVTLQATQNPSARPSFELHINTIPGDVKVVDGHNQDGDPDLVLHFAVCRQAGRCLGSGLPATDVFAAVPRNLIVNQMINELHWCVEHAGEYAVLNACRAWRFALDETLLSKIEGGQWAIDKLVSSAAARELIQNAIGLKQSTSFVEIDSEVAARFVRSILEFITRLNSSDAQEEPVIEL